MINVSLTQTVESKAMSAHLYVGREKQLLYFVHKNLMRQIFKNMISCQRRQSIKAGHEFLVVHRAERNGTKYLDPWGLYYILLRFVSCQ